MNISEVAFIIPSHPPHYHYNYDFIRKLQDNNIIIDIFIVFSNQSDYEQFQLKEHIKPIIITKILYLNKINVYRNMFNSIVTYKKFFGLKQLIDSKYDYFIVCDS